MQSARDWIDTLQLSNHPEGGWFREIYRAAESIPASGLPERFAGERRFSTAIYFLLADTDFSALHRIKQDELWHFYDGTSLTIHMIDPAGEYSSARLGRDVLAGESFVIVVKAGWLFGATLERSSSFALAGCTVAPGFDFADFEMPTRAELLDAYPQHREIVERLTRR